MKTYDVSLTPDAIADLAAIYRFIVDESGYPEIAWNYIERLREKCYSLERAPIRGHKRDDLRANLRILAIDKNAVAAFEVDESHLTVTILNIFYGGEDYETIMGDANE